MKQSGAMNEFDDRREFAVVDPAITQGAGRQQQEGRTQALAPAVDNVLGDRANHHYIGIEALTDDRVGRGEVVGKQDADGFQRRRGGDGGHGEAGEKPGVGDEIRDGIPGAGFQAGAATRAVPKNNTTAFDRRSTFAYDARFFSSLIRGTICTRS